MSKNTFRHFIDNNTLDFIIIGIFFFITLIYFWPIIKDIEALGIQDWDQNFAWNEFSRISLLEYGQFPFWDPFRCGGSVHFANPQMSVISLQTFFVLAFGTVSGIKISILFHSWIGMLGFYLFAKQHHLSRQASFISSMVFSFSGIVSSFLSTGMVVFISFVFLPWIFYFLIKAENTKKCLYLAAILFSACFYHGYQIFLLATVLIGIYYCVKSILERSLKPIVTLIIFFSISAILVLPKLILSLELFTIFPRKIDDVSGYSLFNLIYFLTSKNQGLLDTIKVHNYNYGVDENSLYVGYLPLVFFLFFFIKNKTEIKRRMVYIATLLLVIFMMFGNLSETSLYGLIRNLPVFSSFRVAQRFRFDFILIFSLIVGFGCDRLLKFVNDHTNKKIFFVVISILIFYNLSVFAHKKFLNHTLVFDHDVTQTIAKKAFIQQYDANIYMNNLSYIAEKIPINKRHTSTFSPWSLEYLAIKNNQGVINCYDSITAKKFSIGEDSQYYRGEWYLENNTGSVNLISWSPNQFVFKVSISDENKIKDTLVINQNHYPGWYVEIDGHRKKAKSFHGLLATDISGKEKLIAFKFLPYHNLLSRVLTKENLYALFADN